jgi:hypothetical protein
MSQLQDELEISETGNRIAEPRLDAQAVPSCESNTFSRRDETISLLVLTAFAYFIANIAVGQILRGGTGDAGATFSIATVGSQWILVSIWLGLGNWPLPLRLLAVMFAVAAELLLTFDVNGPPDFWTAVWGGSLMVIATSLPFALLKLFGLRLVHQDSLLDQARREATIQFSIRNLLSWTASAGIIAALFRSVAEFDWMIIEPVLMIGAATAAIGGASIFAALSKRRVWPRALAPLAVALVIGLLFAVSGAPESAVAVFFWATMLGTGATMVVLLLFRRLGWRVAFRPPVAAPTHKTPLE